LVAGDAALHRSDAGVAVLRRLCGRQQRISRPFLAEAARATAIALGLGCSLSSSYLLLLPLLGLEASALIASRH